MNKLKIIFAGTPEFAAHHLTQLLQAQYQVCAVYSQPDRPAGRGKKPQASPVKQVALDNGIPVEQPINFKDPADVETLRAYQADLMIVVAYGLLLPISVLEAPTLGCINVHGSLLPRWRGAAPIQRAIEAGDQQTGVAIMQMAEGLDTGAVWSSDSCRIESTHTGAELHDNLAELGGRLLLATLPNIQARSKQPKPQPNEGVTYAHKLTKAQAEIDWQLTSKEISQKVRAFNSWPVAFFKREQQPIRIWEAILGEQSNHGEKPGTIIQVDKKGIEVACGEGSLLLTELQIPGSKKMPVASLLNSKADWFQPGTMLGE